MRIDLTKENVDFYKQNCIDIRISRVTCYGAILNAKLHNKDIQLDGTDHLCNQLLFKNKDLKC